MTLSFLIMKARSVSKPDLPEKPVTVLSEPQRKTASRLPVVFSPADGRQTNRSFRKFVKASELMGIEFLDFIIIGKGYCSFKECGYFDK